MQQIVQNILVYVVMMLVLRSLIGKESYLEIFRFCSGLILIILCISPALSFVKQGDGWRQEIEEKLFQRDFLRMEREAEMTEGNLEKIMLRECEDTIKDQVRNLAENMGEEAEEIQVDLVKNKEGDLLIRGISLWIRQESKGPDNSPGEIQSVEMIDLLHTEEPAKEREQDQQTQALKKKLCNKFELSKKVVKVWRKSEK